MDIAPRQQSDCFTRRGGRVVECTGLENRRGASHRGFESHPLCHIIFFAHLRASLYFRYKKASDVTKDVISAFMLPPLSR